MVQGGRNNKDPPDQVTQAKKNKENIFVAMSKFPLNAYYTKNIYTKNVKPRESW